MRRKGWVGSLYANPGFPATSGDRPSWASTMGIFTTPGRYRRAFVLQMNIDIKVLPLLMSIDVLFSLFTVPGDSKVYTG